MLMIQRRGPTVSDSFRSGYHGIALEAITQEHLMLSEDTLCSWLCAKTSINPSYEIPIIFLQRNDLYLHFYRGGSEL